jgi:hypothetical protein
MAIDQARGRAEPGAQEGKTEQVVAQVQDKSLELKGQAAARVREQLDSPLVGARRAGEFDRAGASPFGGAARDRRKDGSRAACPAGRGADRPIGRLPDRLRLGSVSA